MKPSSAQVLLIISFIVFCWLAMQAVHECGHVLSAISTDGSVQKVVLHPLSLSRTEVAPNPHPLAVVWGGFLFGTVAPALAWGAAAMLRWPLTYLWRFFAGFCLVANGAYLIGGSLVRGADLGDLMRLGMPQLLLIAVGVVAAVCGMAVWHNQGQHFGFGADRRKVTWPAVATSIALLTAVIAVELIFCAAE